jgi:hypothetical protein
LNSNGPAGVLSLDGLDPGQVGLHWSGVYDPSRYTYQILWSNYDGPEGWTYFATVTGSPSSFDFTRYIVGSTAWFTACAALLSNSQCLYSNIVQVTFPPEPLLGYSFPSPTSVALNWTNPSQYSSDLTYASYMIRSNAYPAPVTLWENNSFIHSLVDTNLTSGDLYGFGLNIVNQWNGSTGYSIWPVDWSQDNATFRTPVGFNLSTAAAPSPVAAGSSVDLWCNASASAGSVSNAWDFGDGTFGNGAPILHTYAYPGTYLATCTSTSGTSGSVRSATIVEVSGPTLGLQISATPSMANYDQSILFTATPSGVLGSVLFWNWTFGDQTLGFGSSVSHLYTPGNYSVSCLIEDSAGSYAIATTTIEALPPLVHYPIAFGEVGLPAGTNWSITLNGTTEVSPDSTLTFNEPNGTYNYTIHGIPGYEIDWIPDSTSDWTGTVTVQGAPPPINVAFTIVTYTLTFQETGLPAGTGWGVLVGDQSESSLTSNLSFLERNGTYGYVILTVSGYVTTFSGFVTIAGGDRVVSVAFTPVTYPVVFTELGLPAGTNWSVTVTDAVTGFNQTESSSSAAIIFFLPNGTYAVTFTFPAGFSGNSSSLKVIVAGKASSSTLTVIPPKGAPATPSSIWWFVLLSVVIVVAAILLVTWNLRRRRTPPDPSSLPGAGAR